MLGFPADHGKSCVMTFIVKHVGTPYQTNLGKESSTFGSERSESDTGADGTAAAPWAGAWGCWRTPQSTLIELKQ